MTKEVNYLYYNREKLYSEVWKQTMAALCKQYGVSHAALVNACETLNVPRPPVGYWTQNELGKAPPAPALPPFDNPPLVLIHPPQKEKKIKSSPIPKTIIQEQEVKQTPNRAESEKKQITPLSDKEKESNVIQVPQVNIKLKISNWLEHIHPKDCVLPEAFEEAAKLIEKEMFLEWAITLTASTEKEHPYVKNTRLELEKKIKSKSVNNHDQCLYECSGKDMFDVEVSSDSVQRALNILQALCFAFEKRGFDLISEWNEKNNSGHIYVIIIGEKIIFSITESLTKKKLEEKDKYGYSKYDYTSTGLLTLKNLSPPENMKCPHWCNDKHKSLLEDKLNNFIIGLIVASAWKKENEARRKKREDEWKRSEELRKEKERNARLNKQRIVNFNKATEHWIQYQNMSAFLTMVKKEHRKSEKKNTETAKWIQWAANYLALYKTQFENLVRYEVNEYEENREVTSNFTSRYNPPEPEPYNYWKRPWYLKRK